MAQVIELKNKNGDVKNVVLGYENIEKYRENPAYFGAVIGRTAGRIKNAELKIGDKVYSLDSNNNGNTLHGGKNSISHRFWTVEKIENGLVFSIDSPHLDNGYPANLEIKVSYILNKNELEVRYFAKADSLTYLNLTNHSYFNLSGNPNNTIYEDILKIDNRSAHSLFYRNYIFAIENAELPTHFTPMDYVTTGRHFIPQ